jgi:hypothetical protein
MDTNETKQDSFWDIPDLFQNLARIMVVVLYSPVIFFFIKTDPAEMKEFLNSFMSWPPGRYFFFFFPLGLLLINLYLLSVGKRTHVPIPRVSRNFIYLSGIVTILLYSIIIIHYFIL